MGPRFRGDDGRMVIPGLTGNPWVPAFAGMTKRWSFPRKWESIVGRCRLHQPKLVQVEISGVGKNYEWPTMRRNSATSAATAGSSCITLI